MDRDDTSGVWLVGVAEGGTLAITATAADAAGAGLRRARGAAHAAGLGPGPGPAARLRPPSRAWCGRRATRRRPVRGAGRSPRSTPSPRRGGSRPRPLLVLVGTADAVVSIDEARQLEAAAGEGGEFLMVGGAGHELRHDPRAIASLLGWLDRQVV